jgi:hypothetical protein
LTYSGEPGAIAEFDIESLVRQSQRAGALIVMACGVGDTIVENTVLLRVHGATQQLPVKVEPSTSRRSALSRRHRHQGAFASD